MTLWRQGKLSEALVLYDEALQVPLPPAPPYPSQLSFPRMPPPGLVPPPPPPNRTARMTGATRSTFPVRRGPCYIAPPPFRIELDLLATPRPPLRQIPNPNRKPLSSTMSLFRNVPPPSSLCPPLPPPPYLNPISLDHISQSRATMPPPLITTPHTRCGNRCWAQNTSACSLSLSQTLSLTHTRTHIHTHTYTHTHTHTHALTMSLSLLCALCTSLSCNPQSPTPRIRCGNRCWAQNTS